MHLMCVQCVFSKITASWAGAGSPRVAGHGSLEGPQWVVELTWQEAAVNALAADQWAPGTRQSHVALKPPPLLMPNEPQGELWQPASPHPRQREKRRNKGDHGGILEDSSTPSRPIAQWDLLQ